MDGISGMRSNIIHPSIGRFVVLFAFATGLQANGLLAGGDQQIASKGPVSLKEARKTNLGIPLPNSASEIQYDLRVGGLQQMSLYLRFHVAPEEADRAIQAIVDHNNRMMNRSLAFPILQWPPPKTETSENHVVQSNTVQGTPQTPSWWETQKVAIGYIRSELAPYAPSIIYDNERSIVYVRQVD